MFLVQGISHVSNIIEHTWKRTVTGHLITSSLEYLRLELGLNINILLSNYEEFSDLILTKSYIQHTWKFMSEYKIRYEDQTPYLKLARRNDSLIMEQFMQKGFSGKDLTKLNKIRMYLRATTISDITSGDGTEITKTAWNAKYMDWDCRQNSLQWPEWNGIEPMDIGLWQYALSISYCNHIERKLTIPLGLWIVPQDSSWQWHINTRSGILYQHRDQVWRQFKPLRRQVRRQKFSIVGQVVDTPEKECLSATTVEIFQTYIESHGTVGSQMMTETLDICEIDTSYHNWLFPETSKSDRVDTLIRDIKNGTAISVSDGSYCERRNLGTASWRIESACSTSYLQGNCISPGTSKLQGAYRSELVGQLAILQTLFELCEDHDILNGRMVLACDGISALNVTKYKSSDKVTPRQKHSDITSAMIALHERLPVKVRCEHVEGHQDEQADYETLDRLAQLNVMMDRQAKDFLDKVEKSQQVEPGFRYDRHPLSFGRVTIHEMIISDCVTEKLYNAIANKKLLEHWIKKGRFDQECVKMIDWHHQEKAMRTAGITRSRFVTKWVGEYSATGKNMQRWQLRPHSNCPYCMEKDEDITHILTCMHQDAQVQHKEALWKLLEKLVKIGTCTRAVLAIKQEIVAWRNKQPPHDLHLLPESLQLVIKSQRKIGWRCFLDGLFSIEWVKYQQQYFDQIGTQKGTSQWISKAIRACWDYNMFVWMARNEQLHKTERIKELEGRQELIEAIKNEYAIGLSRLPAYGFSDMFRQKEEEIVKESMNTMRNWLGIIKQGRIVFEDPKRLHDKFDTDKTYKQSLDLVELIIDNTETD